MLYREIIAVCSEIHWEDSVVRTQKFLMLNLVVYTSINNYASKG